MDNALQLAEGDIPQAREILNTTAPDFYYEMERWNRYIKARNEAMKPKKN